MYITTAACLNVYLPFFFILHQRKEAFFTKSLHTVIMANTLQDRRIAGMITGLVLEGGGMRGIYTAGVLDCLMDHGVSIPNIYGVSAGACHGVSYVSNQRGRAARTILDFVGRRDYASFYNLATTGSYFGEELIYRQIPDELVPFDYDTYKTSGSTLYSVVFNCRTGEAEYLPATDMRLHMEYIKASASLPLLSRMVKLGEGEYLDGGISDSIPLARSIADGNAENLVVLTQHRGYEKKPMSMLSLLRLRYKRYPQLADALAVRHDRYNEQLALVYRQEAKGKAIVIQPGTPVQIGRMEKDTSRLSALYDQGYADTEASLPAIRALCATPPSSS